MTMEKVSHGRPITTAPADADLELSLYDEGEYHVLVFPCRRDGSSCCDEGQPAHAADGDPLAAMGARARQPGSSLPCDIA